MKFLFPSLLVILLTISTLHCKSTKQTRFKSQKVYESPDLVVIQISENAFQHISFLQTQDFGNVPCNGLVVRDSHEVIIFDTPTNTKSSKMLIQWINENLHCKVLAIIPTHFHEDCLGGLQLFHDQSIPSYGSAKTIELAKEREVVVPKNSFDDSLVLKVGSKKIVAKFLGEGHTQDNVVGYFPSEQVLFGGCLIKELGASKGYLGDANLKEWSKTVEKVKAAFPNVQTVVPGHGEHGNQKLLDYTIRLFKKGE